MMNSSQMALIIKSLSYSINQVEILKNIDLSIKKGELVGLIGPNGAGKTTLLKCINGINRASGSIELNHSKLDDMNGKEIAREVSLMHQNSNISFPFPALDIVLMGRYPHLKRMQKETKKDLDIARKQMEFTDTLKFEKTPITEMSGGERQRVLFSKVLAQEADLILLDEPTASLDITHQEQIFKYSRELCRQGRTVIAAIHDIKTASRYCSKLILLKGGAIIAQGTPEEVLTRKNLSEAYGVNALVYRNKITGLLDFHIHDNDMQKLEKRIHIIGGGGSASSVIRELSESGFSVTSGVLTMGDSDYQCGEVFGLEMLVCEPFSDISDEIFRKNIELVKMADITILTNMPFGRQNLKNLEAAGFARRLIIIEDDSPDKRDFSGGEAIEIYNSLKVMAEVTTSARFHEML